MSLRRAFGARDASASSESMLFALALTACSLGEVRVKSTAQLRAALRTAEPADVMLLAPGNYEGC